MSFEFSAPQSEKVVKPETDEREQIPKRTEEIQRAEGIWSTYNENPENRLKMAETVKGYSRLLDQRVENGQVDLGVDSMEPNEFSYKLNWAKESALGFAEQLLNTSLAAGKLREADRDSELAHYKEVVQLAEKYANTPALNFSQSDKLRTIIAAAVHDIAKRAIQDNPNLFLFPHELTSAAFIGTGLESIIEDTFPTLDPDFWKLVAATAAGHGRGEFPEVFARSNGIEYHSLPLNEKDLASVAVHLADVQQGIFGKIKDENGQTTWGESYRKYALFNVRFRGNNLTQASKSAMSTTFKNFYETIRTVQDLSPELRRPFLNEALTQAGAAQAFMDWIEEKRSDSDYGEQFQILDGPSDLGSHSDLTEKRLKSYDNLLEMFRRLSPEQMEQRLIPAREKFLTQVLPASIEEWKESYPQGQSDSPAIPGDWKAIGTEYRYAKRSEIEAVMARFQEASQ